MKKTILKKGFTLTELLAAVVLLGLLTAGVIFTVSKSIKKAKKNYYDKQQELVTQAGREYFNDNRNLLPSNKGDQKCVTLKTLIDNKYIDKVVDYNDESCSEENTKVCAEKKTLTKYSYKTILTCKGIQLSEYNTPTITFNGTDSTPEKNKTQTIVFTVDYTDTSDDTKNLPIGSYKYTIYKMKGSTADPSVDEVFNVDNNTWISVAGEKKTITVPTDILDVSGKYYVVVTAKTKTVNTVQKKVTATSKEVIIDFSSECGKDLKFISNGLESTNTVEKWSKEDIAATINVSKNISKVIVTIKKNGNLYEEKEYTTTGQISHLITGEGEFEYKATSYDKNNNTCTVSAEYKIDKTAPQCSVTSDKSTWTNDKQTLTATCSDSGSGCVNTTKTKVFSEDKDEEYIFDEIYDKAGNIAVCNPIRIMVDKEPPTCSIAANGTIGENNWYRSNVSIGFASKGDNHTDSDSLSYITTESSTTPSSINNTTAQLTTDTTGKTYYGYVKDIAGNVGKCSNSVTVKRDTTPPTCQIATDGTKEDNRFISDVKLTATFRDSTSGVNSRGLTTSATATYNETLSLTHTEDTEGTTYYCYVKDKAGIPGSNSVTIIKNSVNPTCEINVTSGTLGTNDYYTSDVELTLTKSDNSTSYGMATNSTVNYNSKTTLTQTSDTEGTTYYGFVKSSNGKTGTCQKTIKKYTSDPSCQINVTSGDLGSDGYYTNDVELTLTPSNNSTSYGFSKSGKTYNSETILTQTEDTEGTTFTGYVKNKVGVEKTCSKTIKRKSPGVTCSINGSGTLGENNYYTSDINVTLTKSDNATSYGLTTSTTETYDNTTSKTITSDTPTGGVTYHGYVKSADGKKSTCSKTFYRYTQNPSCTVTASGTKGDNDYYTSDVNISLNASANTTSYGLTETSTKNYNSKASAKLTEDTESKTYYGYVKNIAGVEKSCSVEVKRYAVTPTCSLSASGTKGDNDWYTSDVDITLTTTNASSYGFTIYPTPSYNSSTKTVTLTSNINGRDYYGYVKSKAGKTNSCGPMTIKRDATPPTCSITASGDVEGDHYTSIVDLTATFTKGFTNIAGKDLTKSSTATYNGTTTQQQVADTNGTTYYCYVKSESGLTGHNSKTIKKVSDSAQCSIDVEGTLGTNDWYTSDVNVTLSKGSNVTQYGLSKTNTVNYNSVTSDSITSDTDGVTYYGFVKTADGKTATCSKTIKRYTQAPSCSIAVTDGTKGDNDYYTTNVELTMTKSANTTSYGFTTSSTPSYSSTSTKLTQTANTEGTSYYGYVKNKAGTTASCGPTTIKKYDIVPTCSLSASGTKGDNNWYTSDVDITLTTTNASSYGFTIYSTPSYNSSTKSVTLTSDTTGRTYYGYVKSKAGKTNSCDPITIKRDATPPTCNFKVTSGTQGLNNWYITKPTLGFSSAADTTSGLATNPYSISTTSTKNYTQTSSITQSDTQGVTYYGYVKNGAGLETLCGSPNVKVDTIPPKISVKATRCMQDTGGSSGTSSGSSGLVDSNNCPYSTTATGSVDSAGSIITSAATSDLEWNAAGVTYNYTITETNLDKAVWQENNSGSYTTRPDVNTATTPLSTSGTKSLTSKGKRKAVITAKDLAGNESHITMTANIAGAFNLNFNVNGGTAWDSSTCSSSWTYNATAHGCWKKATYGYKYGSLPTPVKSGYKFEGWYTAASGGKLVDKNTEMQSLSDVTIYAHWSKIGYSCTAAESNWSNTKGNIKLTATSASKLEYAKVANNDTIGTYTVGSNSGTSYTTSNQTHYHYKYRIATSNTGDCYSKYDNLKPYAPIVYSFKGLNSDTTVGNVRCTNGTALSTGTEVGEDELDTSSRTCVVPVMCKTHTTGDGWRYQWKVGWGINFLDQEASGVSGSSGRKKLTMKTYYYDGSTCTKTVDENWEGSNDCSGDGLYKVEYTSEDYAGNKSSMTTLIFDASSY